MIILNNDSIILKVVLMNDFYMDIHTQKVVVSLDGGSTTITVDDILGVMYDRDAVVATMDRERFVNIYDQWNDRNVFKLTANRRYICDPTENAIIYLND